MSDAGGATIARADDVSVLEDGSRIAYSVWAPHEPTDAPPLVLTHGLLMNRHMYDRLGPDMAARGHRVIAVDLLGHGGSDVPDDRANYSMTAFASQVNGLLDHLGIDRAVVGGTSLGANVALEFGVAHPERAAGLFVEMPVLDNALVACAVAFTPVLVASQLGAPLLNLVSKGTRRIPRTNWRVDIGLDWARRDPHSSALILQGLLLGRTCPPHAERVGIEAPALIVGHPSDPIHPFSDADDLVHEMENAELIDANSLIEWRLRPERLNDELDRFLTELEFHTAADTAAVAS